MNSKNLSHIDSNGAAHMIDVGAKVSSQRIAKAKGQIVLKLETVKLIRDGLMKKGDVLTVAQIAGIQAAKRTSDLIPLCHPLAVNQISVFLELDDNLPGVLIESTVKTYGNTGVEMEALTAVSIAALTVYDMIKAVEKTARIENIRLVEKRGGKSGDIFNV